MPMIAAASSPDPIEIDVARKSIADIAAYLQQHIGQRPTAYLSGLKDAKTVGQWAAGRVTPRGAATLRLRHAYHAVRIIVEAFGYETAGAWLFGMNRQLDDEAPAFVLRHVELPEELTPVVRAARSFAESGRRPSTASYLGRAEAALAPGIVAQVARLVARDEEGGEERMEVNEPIAASELRNELLEAPGSLAARLERLERARGEIVERLDEVVEYLKDDLSRSSRGASN